VAEATTDRAMRQMSHAADRALVVRQALRRQDRAGRGWQGVFILDLAVTFFARTRVS
jgi:hypothetical protein